jgi:RNA polymerase sigma-70 factor (ECF subfamily)
VTDEDAALAAAFLRDRDEAAFRALYRRHTPALYRVAWRFLGGDGADAEEVVQETWTVAAERLANFHGESSLRSWLTGIALNRCREALRRAARAPHAALDAVPAAASAAAAGASRLDLERALAALPPGYREVLVLHDVEGYSHLEIAEILGVAPGTSKSQLSHARRALRARLGGAES